MTNLAVPVGKGLSTTAGKDTSTPSVTEIMIDPLQMKQNVVYGMNYSVPAVDAFVTSSDFGRRRNSQDQGATNDSASNNENSTEKEKGAVDSAEQEGPKSSGLKRSRRERKTRVSITKTQVRYLVSEVPLVARNRDFLQPWRHQKEKENTIPEVRRSQPTRSAKVEPSGKSDEEDQLGPYPFGDENSVVWMPPGRSHWVDSLSEMVAVCTSAALRRHFDASKSFYPPLSRDYVRDRVDIDDPLIGYQIRHRHGGWLQGFLMFTNFTTWSHYFKWDSTHEASGLREMGTNDRNKCAFDADGALGRELEEQPRSGDPLAGGVVFPTIAEISLVGGLGCGEYLLRMALDDIRSRENYKYVVLQATDTSKSFYERFGFVRVGAISKYSEQKITARIVQDPQSAALSDIVGYRHWTYAHESEQSLGEHGGPSYMMGLRVEEDTGASFLEAMRPAFVEEKPLVKLIGTPTPGSLKKKTVAPFGSPLAAPNLMSLAGSSSRKRRRSGAVHRRGSAKKVTTVKKPTKFVAMATPPPVPAYPPNGSRRRSASKKASTSLRRPSSTTAKARYGPLGAGAAAARKPGMTLEEQRDILMAPPKVGTRLSYNQKQYQSIWLAVPPVAPTGGRRPPRERDPLAPKSSRKRKRGSLVADGTEAILLGAANEIDHLSNIRLKFQLEKKKPAPSAADVPETPSAVAVGGQTASALVVENQVKGHLLDRTKLVSTPPTGVMVDESRDDDVAMEESTEIAGDNGEIPHDIVDDKPSPEDGDAADPAADEKHTENKNVAGESDSTDGSVRNDSKPSDQDHDGSRAGIRAETTGHAVTTETAPNSTPEMSLPGSENVTIEPASEESTVAVAGRNKDGTRPYPSEEAVAAQCAEANEMLNSGLDVRNCTQEPVSDSSKEKSHNGAPSSGASREPSPGPEEVVDDASGSDGVKRMVTSEEINESLTFEQRVPLPEIPPSPLVAEKKNVVVADHVETKEYPPSPVKRSMRKQRMISIPRTIPKDRQLYSKVIRRKGGAKDKYYFVLHYDHDKNSVKMIRLSRVGELTGKRAGRPRFRALLDTSPIVTSNNATDYEIVRAYMVTKTAMVEKENWDILEEE